MDLINQLGISYKAGYLVQGNQLERCKTSTRLQAYNTELQMRSDGKDFDIANILKSYRGNIIFHIPTVNFDLSNLKNLNTKIKNLINNNINLITINASNLSSDLFEWSTAEEQKKYFFNIVTGIATLASNKIVVAIENLPMEDTEGFFGNNISQISDIVVYSRKLLIKDFGFTENDATKYIGICLNIENVLKSETITKVEEWFKVFNKSIKCIKFGMTNEQNLNSIFKLCIENNYSEPILFITSKDLEEVGKDYKCIEEKLSALLKNNNVEINDYKIKPIQDNGFSNIIVMSIIIITVVIAMLMVAVKLRS